MMMFDLRHKYNAECELHKKNVAGRGYKGLETKMR